MKNIRFVKICAMVCSLVLVGNEVVSAAGNLKLSGHIKNIKDGILLESNEYYDYDVFDYDINQNKSVNVFDFCRMKKSILYGAQDEMLDNMEIPQIKFVLKDGVADKHERTYTIPLTLEDNDLGVSAFQFVLNYDKGYFELNDVYTGDISGSVTISKNKEKIQFVEADGQNISGDKTVLYIEFKVKENLPNSLYNFFATDISASHLPEYDRQRTLFKEEYVDETEIYQAYLNKSLFEETVTTTLPATTTVVTTTTTLPATTTEVTTTTLLATTTEVTTTQQYKDKNGSVYFSPGQPQEDKAKSVIVIPVQMNNNTIGVSSVSMHIDYNSALFRIKDVYTADFAGEVSYSIPNQFISFTSENGKDIDKNNGVIAYVELEAICDIQPSLHEFSFSQIDCTTTLEGGGQWKIPQDKCPLTSQIVYFWLNGMSAGTQTSQTTVTTTTTPKPVTTVTTTTPPKPTTTVTTTTTPKPTTTVTTTTTPKPTTTVTTTTTPKPTTTTITTTTPPQTTVTTTSISLPDMPDPSLNSDKVKIANELSQFRVEMGLSELKLDTTLSYIADIRAQEIITKFDTTRPDGTKVSSLLKMYGLSTYSYHEYICYGSRMDASSIISDIKQTDRIIKGGFNKIGVGYTYSGGKNYWSIVFYKS